MLPGIVGDAARACAPGLCGCSHVGHCDCDADQPPPSGWRRARADSCPANGLGLLNDRIVVAGESPDKVVKDVLTRIDSAKVGTVTIYAGVDAPDAEREALVTAVAKQFPKASVELQSGEQALYPYIVAVE